jgi:hypothetical protein
MAATLFVGNDNDVYLQGYRLASTGAAVTDALASFTAYYNAGSDTNPVQGAAIAALTSVSMPNVSGTADYRGKIPGTFPLTNGSMYYIVVTFSNYNDSFAGWFTATPRTGS